MYPMTNRAVPGKPHVYKKATGLWAFNPTMWAGLTPKAADKLNAAAAKWVDRRNYFVAIKAGVALGRALDCRSRGCPVPPDEQEQRDEGGWGRIGDTHAKWKTGRPPERQAYNPEGWRQHSGEELGYGPFN